MMKRAILTFAVLTVSALAFAQPQFGPRPSRPEEMTDEEFVNMQCTFMADRLELKGGQRKEFIKVYAGFRMQIDTLAKKAFKPCLGKDCSEEEVEKVILGNFDLSEKILQIRRDSYPEFKKVLTPSQIQKMYFIENDRGRKGHMPPEPHQGEPRLKEDRHPGEK